MRSTWPVYHPTTGKCVKRNSTEKPSCSYRDGRIQCYAQKQILGLDTCDTSSAKKWKYRGNVNQNIQDTSGNHWQIFSKDWTGSVISGKYPQNVHGYTPSINNKFTFSDGKEPGQVNISANKKYLINNTNTGDVKLVTTPSINTKERRYNFESPIFGRNNDILLNRWYTDPKLGSWKEETKKAFAYLLGNNQSMQRECCQRGGKYHKDLCGSYWGDSNGNSNCEALLSDAEKTKCCQGTGNQHACGKYWGPTHKGDCNNTLTTYCATESGLKDPKCGCLWPASSYDQNVYKVGGPKLDNRCNGGYTYTAPFPQESNDIIDNNCKIIFDRIEQGETIKYSDQANLESACSRYLAEKAAKVAEEQALIRQLKAEEEARKQEALAVVNQISQINEAISQLIAEISQDRATISQLTLGLKTTLAVESLNRSSQASNQAGVAFNAAKEALEVAEQAAVEADTANLAPALKTAQEALSKAEQAAVMSDHALQDANNAKNAADQASLEAQKAQDLKLQEEQEAAAILAKQKLEQQALLTEQTQQKIKLEEELKEQNAPLEVIEQELSKLDEKHQEQQKEITKIQEQELKDLGIISEISTTTWAIIIVVALVILGVFSAVAVKLLM